MNRIAIPDLAVEEQVKACGIGLIALLGSDLYHFINTSLNERNGKNWLEQLLAKMIGINFKILNSPQCFNQIDMRYQESPAYIAHYVYQCEQTYKKRKINLKADDGTGQRNDIGKEIHKQYNDVINLQPQKYINQIKDFLKYYSLINA